MSRTIEDEPVYRPQPHGLRLAVAAPVLAMLLSTLDNLILSTAMPTILSELGGLDMLSWVVTSYALATAASTPIWGKLGDMYGRRNVFLASLAVFLIGSVLAGASGSMGALIAFRVLQGLGGGGLMVGAFSIIMEIVPPREGGKYQGVIATVMGVAMLGGPLIGGVITDFLGWRWSFYINVPLGVLAFVLVATMLDLPSRRARGRIDYLGASLLAGTISAVVLALSWTDADRAGGSVPVLGLFAGAAVGLALFLVVERRAAEPVLPLRLFRDRNFSLVGVVGFLLGLVIFIVMTFVPLYQQAVQGASPTASGLLLLPMLGSLSLVNVIAGKIINRTGRYRVLLLVGGALLTVGMLLLSRSGPDTGLLLVGVYTALYGAGVGLLLSTTMLVSQQSVTQSDLGVASSTITLTRTIGGSFGLAIGGVLFAAQVRTGMAASGAGSAVGSGGQLDSESQRALPPAIRDAYEAAVAAGSSQVFLLASAASALLFALVWFIEEKPLRGHEDPGGPAGDDVTADAPRRTAAD